MPVRSFILLLVTALLIVPSPVRAKQTVLEQVVVQLDWKYQFQYAGFIMAREKGFYAKQGLDVLPARISAQEPILSMRCCRVMSITACTTPA